MADAPTACGSGAVVGADGNENTEAGAAVELLTGAVALSLATSRSNSANRSSYLSSIYIVQRKLVKQIQRNIAFLQARPLTSSKTS